MAVSLVVWLLLWIAPLAHALDRDAVANRNPLAASTPKRIALVIGNDAYQKVSKLEKAGNDAAAMARELKAAGFDVILHRDLNYLAMVKAVETLTDRITGGDQVVVFFAGHGVQIKTGSYLLPVDIEASSEGQVEKTAYALADLTDKLSEAKASFALVLVDACRDNPLKSKGRSVGGSRGLSAVEPPKGQMVVYSASKGQQALDRLTDGDANPNGVFTREFIKRMKQPGVRIEDLMREVQDSVETLAQSISHDQRPAVYNEARGSFYFFGPTTVQVQGQLPSAAVDPETQFWREVKSSGTREYFDAYLEQYPKGKFLVFAKLELKKLDEREKAESAKEAAVKQKSDDRERQDIALRQQGERQQEAVNRELRDAAERAAQDDARQRRKPTEESVVGKWVGMGVQDNGSSWSIDMTIAEKTSSIAYPSLGCGGTLTLRESGGATQVFDEKLTYGHTKCIDNGKVRLTKSGTSEVLFQWYRHNGRIEASGTLKRR